MKLTFLGSSHGVPAADRYCSSLMVEAGGRVYIIDTGAPVVDCLLRNGKHPNDIEAIFYTHAHGDHTSGVLSLLDLVHWYYREASFSLYMTEQRIVDGVTAYLRGLFGGYAEDRMRFSVAPSDFVYEDERIKITYIPTKHVNGGARPSYAMLIEADGKRVLHTGDLSQGLKLEDFPAVALEEETDVVICEMAHFGIPQVRPYMERTKTKQFWFSHVGFKRMEEIEAAKNDFTYPVLIAHDNDVIEL